MNHRIHSFASLAAITAAAIFSPEAKAIAIDEVVINHNLTNFALSSDNSIDINEDGIDDFSIWSNRGNFYFETNLNSYYSDLNLTIGENYTISAQSFIQVNTSFALNPSDMTGPIFIGLQFNNSDEETHYGWIHLDLSGTVEAEPTILNAAWQRTPEASITTPIPEPSTYALAAGIAGLGLAGLRRRRNQRPAKKA